MNESNRITPGEIGIMQSIMSHALGREPTADEATTYRLLYDKLSQDPELSHHAELIARDPTNVRRPIVRASETMTYTRGWQMLHSDVHQRDQRLKAEALQSPVASSSAWTGRRTRVERLSTLKELLPQAQDVVTALIDTLGLVGHNEGPLIIDNTEPVDKDLIDTLRKLYAELGDLLGLVEQGRFDDELGTGLAADAVRLARQVALRVRDHPVRYGLAAALETTLWSCGFPGVGHSLVAFLLDTKQADPAAGRRADRKS